MTTPISSESSSYYDPNAQVSSTAEGDVDASSGPSLQSPARVITIEPVVITGDASAEQLVKKHDAGRRAPDCSMEAKNAALSCTKAGLTAAGGALLSTTGAGVVIGAAMTFAESVSCGKDLRALYDCKTQ